MDNTIEIQYLGKWYGCANVRKTRNIVGFWYEPNPNDFAIRNPNKLKKLGSNEYYNDDNKLYILL